MREVDTDEELAQACMIRAEAYYEEEVHNRFVGSFKKKFAEQVQPRIIIQARHRISLNVKDCYRIERGIMDSLRKLV